MVMKKMKVNDEKMEADDEKVEVDDEKDESTQKSWKRSGWPGSKQGNPESVLTFDSSVRF